VDELTSKSDILKKRLLFEISTGVYCSGDCLASERGLSEKYNVSRNTLRQALDELTDLQILERRPRQGTYISPGALDIISRDIESPRLSVLFVMQKDQVGNPLLSNLFLTCQSRLAPDVKISILFKSVTESFADEFHRADILIVFGCEDFRLLEKLKRKYKSLVLLNIKHSGFNYISPDNYNGGQQMARFIIEYGHKDIGFIGLEPDLESFDFYDRYSGVKDVFAAAGLEFNSFCFSAHNYYKMDTYCDTAVETLLQRKKAISAFICLSDMLAVDVLISCTERRIRVPEDISIIGFDDQYYTQFTVPRITTMKYPAEAMGIRLAEYINCICRGGDDPIQESIAPVLVKRESVRFRSEPKTIIGNAPEGSV